MFLLKNKIRVIALLIFVFGIGCSENKSKMPVSSKKELPAIVQVKLPNYFAKNPANIMLIENYKVGNFYDMQYDMGKGIVNQNNAKLDLNNSTLLLRKVDDQTIKNSIELNKSFPIKHLVICTPESRPTKLETLTKALNQLESIVIDFEINLKPEKTFSCEFLENCKNLKSLRISYAVSSTDIKYIKRLEKLYKLDVSFNEIPSNIKELATLKNLKEFYLCCDEIITKRQLEFLSKMKSLEEFTITSEIDKLSDIPHIKNLSFLFVYKMKQKSKFINNKNTIRTLFLGNMQDDISLVSKMANLESLAIFFNAESTQRDYDKLKRLKNLTELDIRHARGLKNIDFLKHLKLKKLKLPAAYVIKPNDVENINTSTLKEFDFFLSASSDASLINKFDKIETLNLFFIDKYDISKLDFSKFRKLKTLRLYYYPYEFLPITLDRSTVETLDIYLMDGNLNLAGIEKIKDLKSLYIKTKGVFDNIITCSTIFECKKLEKLRFQDCILKFAKNRNVNQLGKLKELIFVFCKNVPVRQLLHKIPNVEKIYIQSSSLDESSIGNDKIDDSFLKSCPKLKFYGRFEDQ